MTGRAVVLRGDAAHLPLPDGSVDAVVCDPPYALTELPVVKVTEVLAAWLDGDRAYVPKTGAGGFMGRSWDQFVPPPAVWDECMRVLKPGGHLLAFAAPRTQDLMGLSIRLAGFEIRDGINWIFGQGYPKSMDVAKAIDKLKRRDYVLAAIELGLEVPGNNLHDWTKAEHSPGDAWWERFRAHLSPGDWQRIEREVIGCGFRVRRESAVQIAGTSEGVYDITAPATEDARCWDGWGTSLKPAHEPIVVARKPLAGTVAANVLKHGTGALNIDGCRVGTSDDLARTRNTALGIMNDDGGQPQRQESAGHDAGRWPPNVLLSEEAAAEMDRQSGILASGANPVRRGSDKFRDAYGEFAGQRECAVHRGADSGGASRFFPVFRYEAKAGASERPRLPDGTAWPTVKPVSLIRWLLRLITPPSGVVLDCFAGTGTTGQAAIVEGFDCILIDRDPQAVELTKVRLAKPVQPVLFDFGEAS